MKDQTVSLRTFDPVHVNTRAHHCSAVVAGRGQRIVTYRGEESLIVGLYFARGENGERELFYILRINDSDAEGVNRVNRAHHG